MLRSQRTRVVAAALGGSVFGAALPSAQASDVEYVGQGTRALGRGGAFAARADDPMALSYNPAALADLPDTQVMLNVQNAFYDACVTREGTYGDNANGGSSSTDRFGSFDEYRKLAFPRVCQNNHVNPGLWLVGTHRVTDRFGVGFGVVTPAAAGHLIWGDGKGATKDGALPSPVRYQIVEQDIKLIQPTLGAGYRFTDWLRIGVSLQWGIAFIKNINYTVGAAGEDPSGDNKSTLNVSDTFVPAVIAAAHFVPTDALDIVLRGRWSDDVKASGKVDIVDKEFGPVLGKSSGNGAKVTSPQPGYVGVALRYADRKNARVSGQIGDPLVDEKWDLELDVNWVRTSSFDAIRVHIPDLPETPGGLDTRLEHRWRDQISLRAGGDYNVVPEKLAVRAGAHYESSALNGSYMGIDFQPAQRVGLHAGATYRVGRWDLSLAYAHIFQETVTVPKSDAAYRQISASEAWAKPMPGAVVNAGTYKAHYDVVSLGATVMF